MLRSSPSEYLAHVRENLAGFIARKANEETYDETSDLRKLFPYLAGYASGQRMFAPRVKAYPGYGIESFVMHLASQCDGALARDGKGFDQGDASEGHRLAAKLSSGSRLALTSSERDWAFERAGKYRQQLVARYPEDYSRVMDERRFLFDTAPDRQALFVQHVRYNEESRTVGFSLPSGIGPREQASVMSEVWALVKAMNVTTTVSLPDLASRLRKDWERHRCDLAFLQNDDGGRDLVDALARLGYTKDERIDPAIDSGVTSFMRVISTPGPDYEGRLLVGYLHCIRPCPALVEELTRLYADLPDPATAVRPAVNLSKKNGYAIYRIFIGDEVVDDLDEIMETHGVHNGVSVRLALEDPKRAEFQHPSLVAAAMVASPAMPGPRL